MISEMEVLCTVEIRSTPDEELSVSAEVMRQTLQDYEEEGKPEGYDCKDCGKVYKSPTTLNYHRLLKHPKTAADVQCTRCDKSYSSQASLKKHIHYKHMYQHRCTTCYRSFETSARLNKHKQSCQESAVACPHCSKIYGSQVSLRNHIRYKHPASSQHWCDICRRAFRSARGLANHTANMHALDATVCRPCARVFPSTMALRSHNLYRHTEGSVRCPHCFKLFTTSVKLRKHSSKRHANVHSCAECGRGFPNAADLDKHVKDHDN